MFYFKKLLGDNSNLLNGCHKVPPRKSYQLVNEEMNRKNWVLVEMDADTGSNS